MALALGPILERSFLQSLYLAQGSWIEIVRRPIAGTMFAVALAVLLLPMLKWLVAKIRRAPLPSA
jgi:putative tricarboxylic transport membrane protein